MGRLAVGSSSSSFKLVVSGLILGSLALYGWTYYVRASTDTGNYDIVVSKPDGFVERAHSPQAVFAFEDKKEKLLLFGVVHRMMSEVNPTPELDTEGIAQYYIDRTHEKMKTWTATKLDLVKAHGVDFRLIRRETSNKSIVTAFGVRGNSTILINMNVNGDAKARVDRNLDRFRQFVASLEVRPYMQPVYQSGKQQMKPNMPLGKFTKGKGKA